MLRVVVVVVVGVGRGRRHQVGVVTKVNVAFKESFASPRERLFSGEQNADPRFGKIVGLPRVDRNEETIEAVHPSNNTGHIFFGQMIRGDQGHLFTSTRRGGEASAQRPRRSQKVPQSVTNKVSLPS